MPLCYCTTPQATYREQGRCPWESLPRHLEPGCPGWGSWRPALHHPGNPTSSYCCLCLHLPCKRNQLFTMTVELGLCCWRTQAVFFKTSESSRGPTDPARVTKKIKRAQGRLPLGFRVPDVSSWASGRVVVYEVDLRSLSARSEGYVSLGVWDESRDASVVEAGEPTTTTQTTEDGKGTGDKMVES